MIRKSILAVITISAIAIAVYVLNPLAPKRYEPAVVSIESLANGRNASRLVGRPVAVSGILEASDAGFELFNLERNESINLIILDRAGISGCIENLDGAEVNIVAIYTGSRQLDRVVFVGRVVDEDWALPDCVNPEDFLNYSIDQRVELE